MVMLEGLPKIAFITYHGIVLSFTASTLKIHQHTAYYVRQREHLLLLTASISRNSCLIRLPACVPPSQLSFNAILSNSMQCAFRYPCLSFLSLRSGLPS